MYVVIKIAFLLVVMLYSLIANPDPQGGIVLLFPSIVPFYCSLLPVAVQYRTRYVLGINDQ